MRQLHVSGEPSHFNVAARCSTPYRTHRSSAAATDAARGGARVAYGSDLLGGMHRHQNEEFRIRSEVQKPLDVIRSATSVAAELLGMGGEIGTLAAGARADLLVLDSDPLADIAALADPARHQVAVVQGGRPVR